MIDAVLADFRTWLESVADSPPPPTGPEPPTVDLATLVGAFTALRHEVNRQTKATRAQTEQVAQALSQPRTTAGADDAVRPLVETLIDLHDGMLLATRELTAARDAWPQPPPPLPRWPARLFPFLRPERTEPATVSAVRERLAAAVTGLQMSLRRVERALARYDLEPVAAEGQPFDPETMEVLEAVAANGRPPGTVVEEVRRGYRWRGRVFRCAQVRVTK